MHFDHVFGRPTASLIPDGWRELVHPDDLAAYTNAFVGAFEQRGPFRMEVRVFDKSGKTRWLRTEGVPRLDDAGAFLGYTGVGLDLTETKIAQEQQGLLINELNHRVKNTLATVQSLVTRTLRGAASPTQARLDIDARLIALARAHDVLTRENWDGAGLREVVRQAIDPFETDRAGRFDVSGPEIRMSPRLSLSLAMILQELATNAVKYGALSNDCGRVQIDWSVIEGEGLSTLRFFWSEKGGPRVQAPQRRGFGTTLIERTFGYEEGGRADLKYLPDGLVAEISVPV
jgi:PAS domain S-box-containing protein